MKETLTLPLSLTNGTLWPTSSNITAGTLYYYTASSVVYAVLCTTSGTTGASSPTNTSGAVTTGGASAAIVLATLPSITTVDYGNTTAYSAGQYMKNAGNIYYVAVGGTSTSTAPTGTTQGSAITVGTATVYYMGAAGSSAVITGSKYSVNTTQTLYTFVNYGQDVYLVTAAGSSTSIPSPSFTGTMPGGTLQLQYVFTLKSQAITGFESIATVEIIGSSSMKIVYVTNGTYKTATIYFQSSDLTYLSHYAIVQAFYDAFTKSAGMYSSYKVPKLPNDNFVSAVYYA